MHTGIELLGSLEGSVAFAGVVFQRHSRNCGETHQYVIELNGPQTAGEWAPLTTSPVAQPVIEEWGLRI
ncbi:MAG: hypothetical protein R3C44_05300 [Chloroflexota bacterium]